MPVGGSMSVFRDKRRARYRHLILVLVVGWGWQASVQAGTGKWWLDPGVRTALALTASQSQAIERLYSDSLPRRRALRQQCDLLDLKLKEAVARNDRDELILPLIHRVARAHQRRNIERRQMLLKMFFVLSQEQRVRLDRLDGIAAHLRLP